MHGIPRRLLLLACALACAEAACSRGDAETIERRVRGELAEVLGVELVSIACAGCAEGAGPCTCQGTLQDGAPLVLDVLGMDEQGNPVIKPHGSKKFEYQVARGFREELRVALESIACPDDGDLAAGFACQATVSGGEQVGVRISAAAQPDRFVWEAVEVLMPGKIERGVQSHLASRGRDAEVDCGSSLRRSQPGATFACALRYSDGTTGTVRLRVVDIEGRVEIQY